MAPYLSVVIPTMRVGGISEMFAAFSRSQFTDFEIVLVDGLKAYRAERVAEEARDRFLRVVHVCPEPNPFPDVAFCAYANAGLAAASGEVVVHMVDYSIPPPDLLGKHAAFHRADKTGRMGMMGPHKYTHLAVNPRFPGYGRQDIERYAGDVKAGKLHDFMLSIGEATDAPAQPHEVDGGGMAPPDADPKLRMSAGPVPADHFHAKNESVRLARALEIGGWDTALDGAHVFQDSDYADRLTVKAGVQWTLDPTAIVSIANPRHVFPFARRSRSYESNQAIWQANKAAGYPKRGALASSPLDAVRKLGAEIGVRFFGEG